MRRLVLLRHGETTGDSAVRYHGSSDLPLSPEGRQQMQVAAAALKKQPFDLIASSPLRRAWQSAWVVAGGRPVRLVEELREIHFGRWEGLTREEIQARDPVLYEDWQGGAPGFEYPGGESRADFLARVGAGLRGLAAGGANSVLLVTHRGVIRAIVELLTGEKPGPDEPALGNKIELTANPDGSWFRGRRSSNPDPLEEDAA